MKRLSLLLAASFVLLFCSVAFGEYYEYIDKDGTVRFTDDPSQIPEDQRPEVKTFESIQSEPQQVTGEEAVQEDETAGDMEATERTETEASSNMDTDKTATSVDRDKADELNTMREELRKTFADLEAEKAAIGPPPPQNAKSGVKADYIYQVTELNRKIDEYHQQSKEFDEKVKAFNSQIGK